MKGWIDAQGYSQQSAIAVWECPDTVVGEEMEKVAPVSFGCLFFARLQLSVAYIEMTNYCNDWKDVAHYLMQYLTPPFIFLFK